MIFTDNKELEEKLISIRTHGKGKHKYDNVRIGINGRLDTIQAAILLAKFDIFPEEIDLRQKVAGRYSSALKDKFYLQEIPEDRRSVWAQYSIRPKENNRDCHLGILKENNIPFDIYYPKMLHLQETFCYMGHKKGGFPISEFCSESILSLPFFTYMNKEKQNLINGLLVE